MRAAPVTIAADELQRLTELSELPVPSDIRRRVDIVLLAAQGLRNVEIAARLEISAATVGKWRNRYALYGVDGLADQPRPGAPRTVDRSQVIAATLSGPPAELGITHWSSRRLATYLGIGDATVARIWRLHGILPRPDAGFSFTTDPEFTASVVEVAGVFLSGPVKVIALVHPERDSDDSEGRLSESSPVRPAQAGRSVSGGPHERIGRPAPSTRSAAGAVDDFFDLVSILRPGRETRLVVTGSTPELMACLDGIKTRAPAFAVHWVEQSTTWVNIAEICCRLGRIAGYDCPAPDIRALVDARRDFVWISS